MPPPDSYTRRSSLFDEKKTRTHSRKPKIVRQWIEFAFAHLHDKLEMFAREQHKGWDVFGDNVDGSISL